MILPLCVIVAAGCSGGGSGMSGPGAGNNGFKLETVVSNVKIPWAMVWTSATRMLFTERTGNVRAVNNGVLSLNPVFTVPDLNSNQEAGLMGMCLHPQYAQNHFVYLSYSYTVGANAQGVKVVRYHDTGTSFTSPQVIIEGIPGILLHAGCRIKFGPDGKLYITTGEMAQGQLAQDLTSLGGKILRLNDDGTVPADNPFASQAPPGTRPEIWTYGNRNPQGIDWQPTTGTLFETEHGPSGFDGPGGGDEVNIIKKGHNYGWNVISHKETHAGMDSPLLEYTPAVAPASAQFYSGDKFPAWKNNFFFGCLVGNALIRVVLNGSTVVSQEKLLTNLGRIRDVEQGPDGYLYVSTSNEDGRGVAQPNDDHIYRLVPN